MPTLTPVDHDPFADAGTAQNDPNAYVGMVQPTSPSTEALAQLAAKLVQPTPNATPAMADAARKALQPIPNFQMSREQLNAVRKSKGLPPLGG
jgi:hypothetical protein